MKNNWLVGGVFCIALLVAFGLGLLTEELSASVPVGMSDLPFGAGVASERASPGDHISENQIQVLKDKIILDIKNAQWSTFTDTNSMDPVLDKGANALQIVPDSASEIQVGDIISYENELVGGTVIHRVIETGSDDSGWFALVKGDNNPYKDANKVRFSQIRRVVVAIVY
ncbi:MAG: hypothetical protein Q7K43_04360 [Candidatus Woesearchaeota archaeon]|nr:hypothetical protein [Candidatus Woesearchaeota archaeon]